MPRKERKSTTNNRDNSSGIITKNGGKVLKKQPISVAKKGKTTCPQCSKPLFNFNKAKSGVCVACLKKDSNSNNKSKATVSPNPLRPTKQVLNSSTKSNPKLSASSNSSKTNSQKNLIASSSSTLSTKANNVKSSSTHFKEQQKSKNVIGKPKLPQSSKIEAMHLRGNKRNYTEMATGASVKDEKVQKKRKVSSNSEQLSKRESRNKIPTVKGSEWMNTIRSRRGSNQQDDKIKKEISPLKNKSSKYNTKSKNNVSKKNDTSAKIMKNANTIQRNKNDSGKTLKRSLKNKELDEKITSNSKKLKKTTAKTTASPKTLKILPNGKGKYNNSNSKKTRVSAKKNETGGVKKDDLTKSIRRQFRARFTDKKLSTSDLSDNVLIAKDIVNFLLESIPLVSDEEQISDDVNRCDLDSGSFPVDNSKKFAAQLKVDNDFSVASCNVNRCDLDSTKLLAEKSTKDIDQKTNLGTSCEQIELSKISLCATGSVGNITSTDIIKEYVEQKCNENIEDILKPNKDIQLLSHEIEESNESNSKVINSFTFGLEKCTPLRRNEGCFAQTNNSETNEKKCIIENDDKNASVSSVPKNHNYVESKVAHDLETNKSKCNSKNKTIEGDLIKLPGETNLDGHCINNLGEIKTDTTSPNSKESRKKEDTFFGKTVINKDLNNSTEKEEESDHKRQTEDEKEEHVVCDESIVSQQTNNTSNSDYLKSESMSTKQIPSSNIKINASSITNHQDVKNCVSGLTIDNKYDKIIDNGGTLEGSVNTLPDINKITDGLNSGVCVSRFFGENNATKHDPISMKTVITDAFENIDSKCELTDEVKVTLRKETGSMNGMASDNIAKYDSTKGNISSNACTSLNNKCEQSNEVGVQIKDVKDHSSCETVSDAIVASNSKTYCINNHQSINQNHKSSKIDHIGILSSEGETTDILCSENNVIKDPSNTKNDGLLTANSKTTNSICDRKPTDKIIAYSLDSENSVIKDSIEHNDIDTKTKNIKDYKSNGIDHEKKLPIDTKTTISIESNENNATTHFLTNDIQSDAISQTVSNCRQTIDLIDSLESRIDITSGLLSKNLCEKNNDSKILEITHNAMLPNDSRSDKKYPKETSTGEINHSEILTIGSNITHSNDPLHSGLIHDTTDTALACEIDCNNVVVTAINKTDVISDQSNAIPEVSQNDVNVNMLLTKNSCENVTYIENAPKLSDTSCNQNNKSNVTSLHSEIMAENANKCSAEEKNIGKEDSTMTSDIEVKEIASSNIIGTVAISKKTEHKYGIEHDKHTELHIQTEKIKKETNPKEYVDTKLDTNSSQDKKKLDGIEIISLRAFDCESNQSTNSKEIIHDNSLVQTMSEQIKVNADDSVVYSEIPAHMSFNVEKAEEDIINVDDCVVHSETSVKLSSDVADTVENVINNDGYAENSQSCVQLSSNPEEIINDVSNANDVSSAVHSETTVLWPSKVEDKVEEANRIDDCTVDSGTPTQLSSNVKGRTGEANLIDNCAVNSGTPTQFSSMFEDVVREANHVDDCAINSETCAHLSSNAEGAMEETNHVDDCAIHSGTPANLSSNVENAVQETNEVDDCAIHSGTLAHLSSNVVNAVQETKEVGDDAIHSGTPAQLFSNVENAVQETNHDDGCALHTGTPHLSSNVENAVQEDNQVDDCAIHSGTPAHLSSNVENAVQETNEVDDCAIHSGTPSHLSSNVENAVQETNHVDDCALHIGTPAHLSSNVENAVQEVNQDINSGTSAQLLSKVENVVQEANPVNDCAISSGTSAHLSSNVEGAIEETNHVDDCAIHSGTPTHLSSNVKNAVQKDNQGDDSAIHSGTHTLMSSNVEDVVEESKHVENAVEEAIHVNENAVNSGTPAQLSSCVEDTVEETNHVDDCAVHSVIPAQLPSNVEDTIEEAIHVDDCIEHSGTPVQMSPETVDDVVNVDDDIESMQCNSETHSSIRMSVDDDNTEMELDSDHTGGENPSSEMNVDSDMNMEVN